ncbi:MAG: hypothetical protein ACREP2_07885 [Rhodanobacteraceae bacterium]
MVNSGFWRELRRRNVVRAALVYAAAVWALAQGISQLSPDFGMPDWITRWFVIACAIGFPFWLVFAWYFEITAHGIKREADVAPGDATARGMSRKLDYWIIGILAVAVVLLLTNQFVLHRDATSEADAAGTRALTAELAKIPAKSIAVLPFENLSNDKNNAYFVDGMQDLILTKLADIGDLKVISRTSTESYGSHPDDLATIAARLGVATFLEGSVQKAGNQVLINVQLIDAKTDAHIWAQSYTRTLDNIFGVEGEVAQKVADALNAKLTAGESSALARVPTTNPQAYDDYLRGLHFRHDAAKGDWTTYLPQAIATFEKAVDEDPDFALAWAALSNAHTDAYYWGGDQSEANLRAAEVAAKRALALDPKLPDAHVAMESVERFLYHNIEAARDQDQKAVDLRPNDADALSDLAIEDANLGDVNGYRFMERAVALEPANSSLEFHLALDRTYRGDYDGARRPATRALAIDPHSARTYALLSRIDVLQSGDVEAAAKVLGGMPPGTPSHSLAIAGARIDLLLYRRDFAGARALAAKYAVEFANGPAALGIVMSQANIEWLAGKKDASRAFYHHAIRLLTKPGMTNTGGDMRMGLAYARLGHAVAAMKQNEMSATRNRRSHGMGFEGQRKFMFAKIQLALGQRAAAIDTLAGLLTPNVNPYVDADHYSLSPAMLRIDPTWDPLRGDPQFQALLKKYPQPALASAASDGTGHE